MTDPTAQPQSPFEKRPGNRPLRAHGYELPPHGPMHHPHRRHFADLESTGCLWVIAIAAVIAYFLGWDMGLWQALFG